MLSDWLRGITGLLSREGWHLSRMGIDERRKQNWFSPYLFHSSLAERSSSLHKREAWWYFVCIESYADWNFWDLKSHHIIRVRKKNHILIFILYCWALNEHPVNVSFFTKREMRDTSNEWALLFQDNNISFFEKRGWWL